MCVPVYSTCVWSVPVFTFVLCAHVHVYITGEGETLPDHGNCEPLIKCEVIEILWAHFLFPHFSDPFCFLFKKI